ncbi:MAG: CBS domain-containing protein [Chromatiaceae bacterium]|jgi:CBS-domain-containing membrane protein
MTAESMMTRTPVTCPPDIRLEDALVLMRQHQVHNLAVVDANGKFLGLLGLRGLVRAMLPVAAQLNDAGLLDLSYLPDDIGELRERLQGLRGRPVADFLHPMDETVVCKPTTSVPELLYLLSRSACNPPFLVVTGDEGELLGVVTEWDILNNLAMRFLEDAAQTGGERS